MWEIIFSVEAVSVLGDNFDCYKNSFCITPNRKEFENIVGKCSSNQDIVNKS